MAFYSFKALYVLLAFGSHNIAVTLTGHRLFFPLHWLGYWGIEKANYLPRITALRDKEEWDLNLYPESETIISPTISFAEIHVFAIYIQALCFMGGFILKSRSEGKCHSHYA